MQTNGKSIDDEFSETWSFDFAQDLDSVNVDIYSYEPNKKKKLDRTAIY